MKIALLTDGIWPFVIGGMQKHSYYLCKYLAKNRIHVDLYHTALEGEIPNICLHFTNEELVYIHEHFIEWPAEKKLIGHYLRESLQYSKLIYDHFLIRDPVDLIYAQGLTSWQFIKEKNRGKRFVPICINVHGYEFYQKATGVKSRMEQLVYRPIFKFINVGADYIYAFGGQIAELIIKHIPNAKSRIIEISNAIEPEYVNHSITSFKGERRFIYLGRYERRKGIEELTEAILNLVRKFDFHFTFIGNIPDNKKINHSSISYLGVVSDKEQIKLELKNSDVLVCPSYAEGMPNVILEGMAAGCAIICTNVGANEKMVSDENGWVIKAGSKKDLSHALVKAIEISSDELMTKRISSVEKIKADFIWDDVIQNLIQSFEDILKFKHQPGSAGYLIN